MRIPFRKLRVQSLLSPPRTRNLSTKSWTQPRRCVQIGLRSPSLKLYRKMKTLAVNELDSEGRTALRHSITTTLYTVHVKIKSLVKEGHDPLVLDEEGNTLCHTAILTGRPNPETLETILELGVDINQPNYATRTPLHISVSLGPLEPVSGSVRDWIRWIVSKNSDIDVKDGDGITPLHLAATISDSYVALLLDEGADPQIKTKQGLTCLHIAARARQSNTIGLLVTLKSSQSIINAKDENGRTALYYACRSGRPESVALLLDAGADPRIVDEQGKTPFEACAEFETEKALWTGYRKPVGMEYQYLHLDNRHDLIGPMVQAIGIKIENDSRPWVESGKKLTKHFNDDGFDDTTPDTSRLGEILDMLLASNRKIGSDVSSLEETMKRSILHAETCGHTYTTECIKHIESQIENGTSAPSPPAISIIRLIPKTYEDDFASSIPSEIHLLAKHGLSRLLEEQRFPPRKIAPARESPTITACRRQLPNMDVLRLLVEDFHDDLNAKTIAIEENQDYLDQEEVDGGDTALHILAMGSYWWNAALGIPYLGSQTGVDVNLRDDLGNTPLHIAVRMDSCFQLETVKALVAIGADVNAIDGRGLSCLALATSNPKVLKLLLDHGAKFTRSAFIEAIERRNVESLDILFSTGIDPNLRNPSVRTKSDECPEFPEHPDIPPFEELKQEWYPLHHALSAPQGSRSNSTTREAINSQTALATLLLSHGADPYAIFHQPLRLPKKQADTLYTKTSKFAGLTESEKLEKYSSKWPFKPRVLIHALLQDGLFVQPLLQLPNLEIEHRDEEGCTLLLSACKSSLGADISMDCSINLNLIDGTDRNAPFDPEAMTPLKYLLSQGADAMVRDRYGRNALHLLLSSRDYPATPSDKERPPRIRNSVKHLANLVPALMAQRDNAGFLPLHLALLRLSRYNYSTSYTEAAELSLSVMDLLDAGADPCIPLPDTGGIYEGGIYAGDSLLHFLVRDLIWSPWAKEKRDILRHLLFERGCDPKGLDREGMSVERAFKRSFEEELKGMEGPKGEYWEGWDVKKEVEGWFESCGGGKGGGGSV